MFQLQSSTYDIIDVADDNADNTWHILIKSGTPSSLYNFTSDSWTVRRNFRFSISDSDTLNEYDNIASRSSCTMYITNRHNKQTFYSINI